MNKKDPSSDHELEKLLTDFLLKKHAELHEQNTMNKNQSSRTVSILTEKETCKRQRVMIQKTIIVKHRF